MTNISDMLTGGNRDTIAMAKKQGATNRATMPANAKGKKKENMYQFVEWSFQKRKDKGSK